MSLYICYLCEIDQNKTFLLSYDKLCGYDYFIYILLVGSFIPLLYWRFRAFCAADVNVYSRL